MQKTSLAILSILLGVSIAINIFLFVNNTESDITKQSQTILEREISTLEESNTSLSTRLKAMEQQLEQSVLEKKDSTSQKKASSEKITELKNTLEIIHQEKNELLRQKADLEKTISKISAEQTQTELKNAELKKKYRTLIEELNDKFRQKDGEINNRKGKLSITFLNRILFDTGETELTRQGQKLLKDLAGVLKRNHISKIKVAGHTDNTPIAPWALTAFPSNWELSAVRAASVIRFLQFSCKIPPEKMELTGHSFYKPVSPNDTATGKRDNRRVEIFMVPEP